MNVRFLLQNVQNDEYIIKNVKIGLINVLKNVLNLIPTSQDSLYAHVKGNNISHQPEK